MPLAIFSDRTVVAGEFVLFSGLEGREFAYQSNPSNHSPIVKTRPTAKAISANTLSM
jgi:hypothetical protein